MAYASVTYTSASGTTFALTNSSGDPIEYLRQNDISVTVNGVLKTLTTDYTFNTAGTAIVLNTAVSGATVLIARTTDIADATVSFTAGSTLTAQDLNNSDKQNRFALQEFSDVYDPLRTGTGDLGGLAGFIGSSETWVSDNAHAPTTGAVDSRVDSKIDTALTTDVVAGDSITVTDNSPSSGQITIGVTNASISTAKLVDSSVTTAKIADGNVTTAKILDANVTTAKLADSNVTTAKIADSAVTSAKIADGTIVAGDIAADAVTTAKILDSNITTGKIADGAVTTAKLADSSVTSAKIVDGTIVAGDLASDSVTTAKIVDSNVTTAKINDSAVTTGKIADSAVTAIKIADGVITSAKLNAATVVTAAEQAACTPDDVTFFTTSASDGRYVNVTGDSMTGALAMGSNKITGLGAPTANADAATKQYVDTSVAAGIGDADYGDITVSGTGTVWTIDSGVVTSAKIADGTIVNDDINAAAAIAGTKISPDFGSQNITTTGTSTAASFIPSSSTAPTNGVYLPAANTVAISTGGSGRLFVDATGGVQINKTGAGGAKITSTVQSTVYFSNAANTGGYIIGRSIGSDNAHNLFSYDATNSHYVDYFEGGSGGYRSFYTNGSERLRITSAGLVGVGTSSPGAQFEIIKDSTFNNESTFGLSITDGTSDVKLACGVDATNDISFIQSLDPGTAYNTRPLTLNPNGGNVGIGTTSPGNTLHLVGTNGVGQRIENTSNSISAYSTLESSGALQANISGSGFFSWVTGGGEKVRIDNSGRFGIGTTSPGSVLDCRGDFRSSNADSDRLLIYQAPRGSAPGFASGANGSAGIFTVGAGVAVPLAIGTFANTPLTLATDNTPRLTVTGAGNVGIGTTSPGTYNANLAVYSAGGAFVGALHANASGTFPKASAISLGSDAVSYTYTTGGSSVALTGSAHIAALQSASSGAGTDIAFINTAGGSVSEKARLTSDGKWLVGTSSARGNFFNSTVSPLIQQEGISGSGRFMSVTYGTASEDDPIFILGKHRGASIGGNTIVANGDGLGKISFQGSDGSELVEGVAIRAEVDGTPGANDMPGRLVFSTTADGASSPMERMRINSTGGLFFGVTTTATPGFGNTTVGATFEGLPDGRPLFVSRANGIVANFNRNTDDGLIIAFAQDGLEEGSITVSGTTVSYNGAHLSRWSQLPSGAERIEILRGSVLSNLDEMCEWGDEDNEQHNRMKVSDVEGDKNVSGVFQAWDDDDDTYINDFYCAMTGDFIIRIGAGVTVERGDLLMSAGDGTAKPQDDDIIRSKTIAKVTSTHVTCTYDDGSYCVPCVLMAC